jgi:hypothetical protein
VDSSRERETHPWGPWRALTPALLFALCLGGFGYFYQAGSWNSTTRFDLVRAIVERHTLSIDAYHMNTGDKALRNGSYYCDKAPGVSLLCVPSYAVVHFFDAEHQEWDHVQTLGSYLCVLSTVSLPSALAVVMLFALLRSLGLVHPWPLLLATGYAFGTLVWPYSTLFYGHQAAAAWGLIAFALLARSRLEADRPLTPRRAALAGCCLGLALLVEYTAGLAVGCVALYAALTVGERSRLAWIAAGAALPVAVLLAYHWAAFGGPLTLPYSFSTQAPRHGGFFMGIGLPSTRALYYLLIDEYRGLFYSAPWLLLGVPGLGFLLAARRTRPEALVASALVIAHVAVAGGLRDWHGGWAMGPRHLIATLPWLVLGVAALGLRFGSPVPAGAGRGRVASRRLLLAVAAAGIAYSGFMMLVGTSVKPEVPRAVEQPFDEYLFPRFFAGELAVNTQSIDFITGRDRTLRFAWNVGELMGLEGLATLAPLALWLAALGGWLVYRESRPPPAG